MSFSSVLKEAVDSVKGSVSAMVLGVDGMPVEQHTVEKVISLDDLSAEASQMIKDIDKASHSLGVGDANEFSIISDKCGIFMHRINSEYYLALIIKPGGNFGKGRFKLRVLAPKLMHEL